ncbi:aromatic ring-hydroxylating oxygenase subunit alpha [Undibacterium sp. SXout11W]|uniref:aromatic ring-hydroxylating oxygenase subunit alpha n=1 Tax=Undibacterium sp. SXout11W TaxID=3413050 RepID=UPI003BF45574
MTREQLLRDSFWHLACHRSELPGAGSYLKLKWLNEDLVVFNDAGELLVFDNVCPHRGARFFSDESGKGALSCSYHGWTFHGGKTIIPCIEKYNQEELATARLTTLKTSWCGDFLFVGINPRSSIEEQLGQKIFDLLASISMDIDGRVDFNAYVFECDWKFAIENALDTLHIPYIHPESLGVLDLTELKNEYFGKNSIGYFQINDVLMKKKLSQIKRMFDLSEQFEGYMNIYMFPFTMLTSTFGYSYSLQNFFPSSSPDKTFFNSRLLKSCVKKTYPSGAMDFFFNSTAAVNRQVFDEDHQICKRIATNFYDENSRKFLSSDEEKIAHFRKSLKELI